jgi:hypothetical protein
MASPLFVIILGTTFILSMAATANAQDHACSLARSAGKWSFTDNGTVVGVGPRTAVGAFTLDEKGNVLNGVATSSLNGSVAQETFSGSYTVNSDCTGGIDVKIYSGGIELFEVTAFTAYDDDMKQLRAIFTAVTTPDGTILPTVITLEARKQ